MGKGEIAVVVDGFNVYAGDAIDELRYELKKAWRDGISIKTA